VLNLCGGKEEMNRRSRDKLRYEEDKRNEF
jgi:hypothetical protein